MSEEIFISYKSERRAAAQHFATVLRHHGFSVWFDYSLIKGRDFGLQIDGRIRAAKALVVLWCSRAVGSRWVIEEVDLAHHLGILIPVKIEACELPTGFRRADYIDLSGWDGNPRGQQIDALIDELEKRVGRPAVIDRAAIREYENTWRMFGAPSLQSFGLGAPAAEQEVPRLPASDPIVVTGNVFTQPSVTVNQAPLRPQPSPPLAKEQSFEHGAMLSPGTIVAHEEARLAEEARRNPLAAGGYEDAEKRLIRTLTGHGVAVNAAAFSPEGKTIVSGSEDNTLKLWDAQTGREIRTLRWHGNWVRAAAFSPDGKTIVSASDDKTLKLWDAQTGREIRRLSGHGDWVRAAAFSPDGKTIVSASDDKTLKLWDASTGREIITLLGHRDIVWAGAFSPDGKTVVSASKDKTLKLWDAATGREIRILKGHGSIVWVAAFAPDGKTIVSASDDNTLKLWDANTGRVIRTLRWHGNWVRAAAFSPDGKTIVSGSRDNTLKLWDSNTGRVIRTLTGHGGGVLAAAFSPDGKTIVSASEDKTVKLWDVSEWTMR
ncbi:MAG: TIR domain-containing protein [Hyphomicrobiales bacterium]|nr:TIR domain-containing protein [Hyphomicrobiales bacterium]